MARETIEEELLRIHAENTHRSTGVVMGAAYNRSLEDVEQAGVRVLRTNHLGNDYPSNQAFVNSLDQAMLVSLDHNNRRDENYYPWMVRMNGVSTSVAAHGSEQLSPYYQPNEQFREVVAQLPKALYEARTPAQLHYMSARLIQPQTVTVSEWMLRHPDMVADLAQVISADGIPVLNRVISETGDMTNCPFVSVENPGKEAIKVAQALANAVVNGDPTPPKQPLYMISNHFAVYLLAAIEALDPKHQKVIADEQWGVVYHGSGPDMIRYLDKYGGVINGMHKAAVAGLPKLGIPSKIFFGVLPTAELKFAVPGTFDAANRVGQHVKTIIDTHARSKDFEQATDTDRREARAQLPILRRALKEMFHCGELQGVDLKSCFSRNHPSHYDALIKQEGYHFPPQLKSLTFQEISVLNGHLLEIKNQK